VSYPNNYIFKPVAFHYSPTLSEGMAWASSFAKNARCGVSRLMLFPQANPPCGHNHIR